MGAYQLFVRAGSGYKNHEPIRVNQNVDEFIELVNNEDCIVRLAVRIQDFQGHSNKTSDYFQSAQHKNDQFGIQLSVTFKDNQVNGDDLSWGNDFDQPIRDILPYGFSIGYNIMKWAIDPSIDGDAYADEPYLYGKALTSMNIIQKNEDNPEWPGLLKEENLLEGKTSSERSKYFLDQTNRKEFNFEPNVQYSFDFSTPYISLGNEFAIKLPGYNLNMEKYCGSQPLRYVLKDTKAGKIYAVILFDVQRIDST